MGQTGRRSIATYILAVKIASGRLHFHGFGVARQGPWVTSVNYARICSRALQANRPDAGIECVGYVENSRIVVEVHIPRLVEPHFGRRPLLAVETHLARAGHSRDRAVFVHLADPAIVVTRDEQVSLSIEGDAGREVQSSFGGRSSVPRVAFFARPRDRVDDAVFVHLADPVVLRIGDVHVTFAIECEVVGLELRLNSWTADAREACSPGASHGGDRPGAIDLSHAELISQVEVPSIVEGYLARSRESGGGGRASVTGISRLARASDGGDDATLVHLANPIDTPVRDVEVPLPVHRHGRGGIESCLGGGSAITGETVLSGAS